ncbi:uncharacterized protein BJ171DRAFT_212834 [Polychytrium aggregatum]|uniref:uncharacterized protein n=1 Tax=Polychytrium aggregatum TaxID=110093 RepID=UPI0022FF0F57|nr:uncharacterized protein BJ171DRAFT_212834 [Polychytrium aggregatum]KAI9208736.1 hypothetical protein BJ171DRAFT_212834 [Polychytrium aggregatum]
MSAISRINVDDRIHPYRSSMDEGVRDWLKKGQVQQFQLGVHEQRSPLQQSGLLSSVSLGLRAQTQTPTPLTPLTPPESDFPEHHQPVVHHVSSPSVVASSAVDIEPFAPDNTSASAPYEVSPAPHDACSVPPRSLSPVPGEPRARPLRGPRITQIRGDLFRLSMAIKSWKNGSGAGNDYVIQNELSRLSSAIHGLLLQEASAVPDPVSAHESADYDSGLEIIESYEERNSVAKHIGIPLDIPDKLTPEFLDEIEGFLSRMPSRFEDQLYIQRSDSRSTPLAEDDPLRVYEPPAKGHNGPWPLMQKLRRGGPGASRNLRRWMSFSVSSVRPNASTDNLNLPNLLRGRSRTPGPGDMGSDADDEDEANDIVENIAPGPDTHYNRFKKAFALTRRPSMENFKALVLDRSRAEAGRDYRFSGESDATITPSVPSNPFVKLVRSSSLRPSSSFLSGSRVESSNDRYKRASVGTDFIEPFVPSPTDLSFESLSRSCRDMDADSIASTSSDITASTSSTASATVVQTSPRRSTGELAAAPPK